MKAAALLAALALTAAPAEAFWLGPRAQSRRLDAPIAVDGRDADWPPDGDEAEGLRYLFANDSERLCLLLSPHTKDGRVQMAGLNGQDFTLWLDPKGGSRRALGLRLPPPERGDPAAPRPAEAVGLDAEGVRAADAELRMGPVLNRGAFEACIPLKWLGPSPPKKIGVGFAVSALAAAKRPRPDPRRPHDLDDALSPLFLWVQVRLAPAI
ncbi:MAG: hypothetical protein HY552_05425 [Elusimicrobia bacterium]|nr:hypothetical protein [Elusimicrobiota bacterium]